VYSKDYVWAKILAYIEEKLEPLVVGATFDDAEIISYSDEKLILFSPTDFRRDTIRNTFMPYIMDVLQEKLHSNATVEVFGQEELDAYRGNLKQAAALHLNPQYTFDTFVVGESNRFAHSSALAVSNYPGDIYNPLFIYGPPGVGKTHLLYAIANAAHQKNPAAKIVYIKGEDFLNDLVYAIQTGRQTEFRNKYRNSDLLLIDDIQFISGKESTQIEFFHTFNSLYEAHKQIVLTSDRKPSDMLTLEERLRTRFEWGLVSDIQAPDYETRMAIIYKKADSLGLSLPDDVCQYIANNITNNVRQLEGTVKKIKAYRDINQMPLDLAHISKAIDDMFKNEGNALPTPALILKQVGKFYNVEVSMILGTQRGKAIAEARQVAIYLMRKMTNLSSEDIGREFKKDHATILYSVKKVEKDLKDGNETLSNHVCDIMANINSSL